MITAIAKTDHEVFFFGITFHPGQHRRSCQCHEKQYLNMSGGTYKEYQ